jgi:hypothetical protein
MKTAHEIAELILKTAPRGAVLIINGAVVKDFEIVNGRIKDGYMGQFFTQVDKGRIRAVQFTHPEEGSDGEIRPSSTWVY